jgi:hypothetical protein
MKRFPIEMSVIELDNILQLIDDRIKFTGSFEDKSTLERMQLNLKAEKRKALALDFEDKLTSMAIDKKLGGHFNEVLSRVKR